ncbi:MAG: hypothetical protein M3Z18_08860 [Gemmatimonadota bacterium]|nr:hypothetical protein [Gemmatimonadota bacterium]
MISLRQGTLAFLFAAASATRVQPQSLNGPPVTCKGERISRIDIDASPPFRISGTRVWERAGRFAAKQHVTTKEWIIRRYLALQEGDACTEVRRGESERILRAQPFIADATVLAYPDGNGGVFLTVSTVDEVSLILRAAVTAKTPHFRGLTLGEANLLGRAIHAESGWKAGLGFRDEYEAKVIDYQFMGRPYQARLEGGRRQLGSDWQMETSHPFLTDLQRISWRTTAGNSLSYFSFRRPNTDPKADAVALRIERSYSDIGGVFRIGPPLGRLALIGGSISFEDERPGSQPVIIGDSTVTPDTSQALINRYTTHQTARINGLWGVRNIHFVRVSGFDALEGTQDLRTGVEVATLVGKGVRLLRGKEQDWFGSTSLYAGWASQIAYSALEVSGEGRRDQAGNWDGILAHGRAALYMKPFNRQTFISDLTWSGGWKQRIPFQLTFADRDGGLRGFRRAQVGGARRLIGRVEDRYLIGRYKRLASIGVAGFAEAGKLWAGDSPFGVNTPLYASAGFSILAASPPQSRRTIRADFAFPVRGRNAGRAEVRIIVTDFTRMFRIEPRDVYNSRERSVPTSVFSWP